MSELTFTRATKRQSRARVALVGPAGSGKTFTALAMAGALANRVALIDTEHGSASKYADLFEFDTLPLDSYAPQTYMRAVRAAETAGYGVLIIDSLSHAWAGRGGVLEIVDKATQASRSRDSYTQGWSVGTPLHQDLLDTILSARLHIIVTMRTKTAYEITGEGGAKRLVRLGLAPVQRDGVEYEFDLIGTLDERNTLVITKTRAPGLRGLVVEEPGSELGRQVREWLEDGAEPLAEKPRLTVVDAVAAADAALDAEDVVGLRRVWTDAEAARLLDDPVRVTETETVPLRAYIAEHKATLDRAARL